MPWQCKEMVVGYHRIFTKALFREKVHFMVETWGIKG